jgi:hypothetical protein
MHSETLSQKAPNQTKLPSIYFLVVVITLFLIVKAAEFWKKI